MRAVFPRRLQPAGRSLPAVAGALMVVALTGGCGFLDAAAAPATPSRATPTPTSAAASPTPDNSAAADLTGAEDGRSAALAVSVADVRAGIPYGLWPGDCELVPEATEFATVSVVFTDRTPPTKQTGVSSNLRLDVTVTGGSGIGLLGPVTTPDRTNCNGTTVLPVQETLQSENLAEEHQTMTLHIVGRTTPADPHPLHGLTLELRDPRHHPDGIDSDAWAWNVARVTAGAACPDDVDSLCIPLD